MYHGFLLYSHSHVYYNVQWSSKCSHEKQVSVYAEVVSRVLKQTLTFYDFIELFQQSLNSRWSVEAPTAAGCQSFYQTVQDQIESRVTTRSQRRGSLISSGYECVWPLSMGRSSSCPMILDAVHKTLCSSWCL